MRRYTLWRGSASGDTDEPLLEDEPMFLTHRNAFNRARALAKNLVIGWDKAILVRLIRLGCDTCIEWVFTPEELYS